MIIRRHQLSDKWELVKVVKSTYLRSHSFLFWFVNNFIKVIVGLNSAIKWILFTRSLVAVHFPSLFQRWRILQRILPFSRAVFCASNLQALIPRSCCFTKRGRFTFFKKHVGVNVVPFLFLIVAFITPLRILLQCWLVCCSVIIIWGWLHSFSFGAGWTFLVTLGFSLTFIYNCIGVVFVVFSNSLNGNIFFLRSWDAKMNCKFGGAMQVIFPVTGLFSWLRRNLKKCM